jgi:3-oxoadipate enol-lactonase
MRVRTGDFDTHCRVVGPEGTPWITFINSIASDLGMWRAQVDALAGRYRLLCYDVRGHGGSDAPPPPYSFDQLVGDLAALWDGLAIQRGHVVGLSLGGMIAVGATLSMRERVASLTIANSMMEKSDVFVKSWNDRIALAREQGIETVVEPTLARWLTSDFVAREPARAEAVRDMIRGTSLNGFIGTAEALKTLDYRRQLSGIAVPTLFIAGTEDIACPVAGVRADATLVPGAEVVEIAGAAHISNIEQPDAFSRIIGAFIAAHD